MRTIGLIGLCAGFTGTIMACSSSSSPATGTNDAGNQPDATGVDGSHRDTGTPTKDGGHPMSDGSQGDGGVPPGDDSGVDSGTDTGGTGTMDAGKDAPPPGPEQLLITFNGAMSGETVVMNVGTKAIEGRISFVGSGITDAKNASSPFLLEQSTDIVAKLDPVKPWTIDSTWNMQQSGWADGGVAQYDADPVGVVVETGTQAYVLRQNRNQIAVINESNSVDGGAPGSTISLASLVQTGDTDHVVEMTTGAYVASSHRLYVTLANIDQNEEATYNGVICGAGSTLTAIDTTTNAIVNLGGSGPGGSIPLTYYDPVNSVYDAASGRILIVGAGCYAKPAGGGTIGAVTMRGVEAVDLATGKTSSLLNLTTATFPAGFVDLPTSFVYIDSTHAVLGFDSTGAGVYTWDPTKTTIGDPIPNAPDVFTYDGKGNLVGTRVDTSDAGVTATDVVSVAIASGTSTTLGKNVTSLTGTVYVGSVDVWPHP